MTNTYAVYRTLSRDSLYRLVRRIRVGSLTQNTDQTEPMNAGSNTSEKHRSQCDSSPRAIAKTHRSLAALPTKGIAHRLRVILDDREIPWSRDVKHKNCGCGTLRSLLLLQRERPPKPTRRMILQICAQRGAGGRCNATLQMPRARTKSVKRYLAR